MANFVVDNKIQTFTIVLGGHAKDGEGFVDSLKEAVSKIQAKQYTLIIDAVDLRAFRPKGLVVLEQSYKLYMSFGFRQIIMILPDSITCRLQVKRIGKEIGYTGVFAKDRDEAKTFLSA